MKISLGKLYTLVFILVYFMVYFLAGWLQFFLGIPYVGISFGLILLLGSVVMLYLPKWNFRYWDLVIIVGSLYALLILVSGLINGSDPLHIFIYLFFPILPMLIHLFTKAGIKEKVFFRRRLSLLFMYTACLQFPFILGQKLSYDFMKGFNQTGQQLIPADFWFGTFPFKADHAMGFFMLLNILNIYWNNKHLKLTKYPWLVMGWIAFTVFITDTKITQLLIALMFVLHAYIVVPRRVKIIGVVTVALAAIVTVIALQTIPILRKEYEYSQKAYTLKHSKWTYESGIYARRPNIVIYYVYFRPFTLIGNGPYDYFNFKEGKFRKTHHFSQLIWTYNDLGFLGIVVVILFMYFLVKSLSLSRWRKWLIFLVLMIYAFMTVALFDFALMLSLLLVVNKNFLNEPHTNTLSRS